MADQGLTVRESNILVLLLRRYADTKKPVPSSYLFEVCSENLAASSLRAVLNNLEKKGYLSKEHISSGRVPTDLAYKYFASMALAGLSIIKVKNSIRKMPEQNLDISEMARGLAAGISEKHRSVGFATAPSLMEARLQDCEIYPLQGGRAVLFCLMNNGRIYERVIGCKNGCGYEHLRAFGNYITRNFRGKSFREIRGRLKNQLVRDREKVAGWVLEAMSLVAPALEQVPGESDLFLTGLQWLVDIPEIAADRSSFRLLVETMERKEKLLALLDSVLEEGRESAIVLGSDLPLSASPSPLALMAVSYGTEGSGRGIVGLIGYKAMKYDEALPNLFSSAIMLTEASINLSLTGGKDLV